MLTDSDTFVATLLSLAARHGLDLEPGSMRFNDSGLDFRAAYARDNAGQDWVLRQPRRPDVIAAAAREARILSALGPHMPVALPQWRIHSPELIAYPLLAGEPAGVIDPALGNYRWSIDPAALPEAFVDTLAKALAALHSLPPQVLAETGAPYRSIDAVRAELAIQIEQARELLTVPPLVSERWQRWLADESCWPATAAPLHGDMHPGHQLLNAEHQLTGLIDWTEAAVGDPSSDFVAHLGCFGEAALQALLTRYAAHGGQVWPRLVEQVQARWSAYPVSFAAFARLSGELAYLPVAQAMLDAQI